MARYEAKAVISIEAESPEEAMEAARLIACDREIEHRIERMKLPATNGCIITLDDTVECVDRQGESDAEPDADPADAAADGRVW